MDKKALLARRLYRRSMKELGHVVIIYKRGMEKPPGSEERELWNGAWTAPEALVVKRQATMEEWFAQINLFMEVTKLKPSPDVHRPLTEMTPTILEHA